MIRRQFSLGTLVVVAGMGCGTRDDVKADVGASPTVSSALTAAQIQAARNAQLLNGYIRPTFYEPMANFPFAGPDDTSVFTQANRINNAGVVIGTTNRGYNLGPGGGASSPYFVDAAGHQTLLDNPWPGGPAYLADVNQRGDMVGYGGPGSPTDNDFTRPVVFHPDRSYDILRMPKPGWTPMVGMWVAGIGNDGATGLPTVVGTAAYVYAGTLAVWHFENDTVDAVGPSEFPTTGVQFTEGHNLRSDPPAGVAPDVAAYFDGSACLVASPGTDTSPWSGPGLTLMAWVRPDAGMCPGGLRAVARRSDDWGFSYDAADLSLVCNADGTAAVTGHLLAGSASGTTPAAGRIPLGEWTHVAVTSDTMHTRSYVNGTLVAEAPNNGGLRYGPPGLAVGCRPGDPSSYFKGAIDEVSLFQNSLGGDQIRLYGQDKGSYPRAGGVHATARYQQGFFDLVMPPAAPGYGPYTMASALSDTGVLSGVAYFQGAQTAAIFDPATGWKNLNDLIPADSGWDLRGTGRMNAAGQIVVAGEHDGRHAMGRVDLATGEIIDLGHDTNGIWADPIYYTLPSDINAAGHVVGSVYDQWPYWPHRAVFYTDESGLTDLNDLLAPDLVAAGWVLQQANGINDSDDVVGYAINSVTGVWRAFKVRIPTLPSPDSIAAAACEGKADGAACVIPDSCGGLNNVCNAGVCGGDLGGICLRADGVVDMGGGNFVAVFGHNSSAATSLRPTTNQVLLNGTAISSPRPTPPSWLPPGNHAGSYLPTFVDGQTISWRVNGQLVSASASSPRLEKTPGTGVTVTVGGEPVIITPDLAKYEGKPDEPQVGREPDLGDGFLGALEGTLTVGPSGAAIYTVPISIPPGVAGMAPNLSLVYNSQAGNGIAGQGWELGGLSLIHRCPKTRVQDGAARPIVMDALVNGSDEETDGVCLDGQRLFEEEGRPGHFKTERDDFSQITRIDAGQGGGASFMVSTKSGEIRFYGQTDKTRIKVPRGAFDPTSNPTGEEIAVWALDRVIDDWGNYFDIQYNNEQADFLATGLRPTRIDYTGHVLPEDSQPDAQPFSYVTFRYDEVDRPDVRWVSFGATAVPRNRRLKSISTPRGTYTLSYDTDNLFLPSRLKQIDYCAAGVGPDACLRPLVFDWDWAHYSWKEAPEFRLPAEIGLTTEDKRPGTQLVDVNGDGRVDLVKAKAGGPSQAWENTGEGWQERTDWALPANLVDGDGTVRSLLADFNGDGLPDLITRVEATLCDFDDCDLFDVFCKPKCIGHLEVYLNRIKDGGGWEARPSFKDVSADDTFVDAHLLNGVAVVDIDGDGLADLVRPAADRLHILFSDGERWIKPDSTYYFPGVDFTKYRLEDINRDGLPDLVTVPDPVTTAYDARLNRGDRGMLNVWKPAKVIREDDFEDERHRGDINGDGLYDTAGYFSMVDHFIGTTRSLIGPLPRVNFATGVGYSTRAAAAYETAFSEYAPPPWPIVEELTPPYTDSHESIYNDGRTTNYYESAFVDLNADGLVDLVFPHDGGGQLLINTGTTWKDHYAATTPTFGPPPYETQRTFWHLAPGPFDDPSKAPRNLVVPAAPYSMRSKSAFVDLNGDGVTDVVETGQFGSGAWLNTFRPPVINKFPSGLAKKTQVTYSVITTKAAKDDEVYADPSGLETQTRYLAVPLRVVAFKHTDPANGSQPGMTRYSYSALRGSKLGRGPLGFRATAVTEDVSGMTTNTSYRQAYPYTGMPWLVTRDNQGLVSTTETKYCDTPTGVGCTSMVDGKKQEPGRSVFVYPKTVKDTTLLRSSNFPEAASVPQRITTTTDYVYDESGNPIETTVTTEGLGETYEKKSKNDYGGLSSKTRRLGRAIRVETRTKRLAPVETLAISHVTELDYGTVHPVEALGLLKMRVEPTHGTPFEVHTAYEYDSFGNVTASTSCAADFDHCSVHAKGPGDAPFRTTKVSYDPADFVPPAGSSPQLVTSLDYKRKGRFPVRTTNALEQSEYVAYDPIKGVLRQQTGPNGITTCHLVDDYGREIATVERCGSAHPLLTSTFQYLPTDADPVLAEVVTVTRPPTGGATFSYADGYRRPIDLLTRSFDGGLLSTYTSYDDLGRVHMTSKPYRFRFDRSNPSPTFYTVTDYDPLGRVIRVSEDLSSLDGSETQTQRVITTTYLSRPIDDESGSTILTETTVNGETHDRWETKNVLGKVSSVRDTRNKIIRYSYDPAGNLTDTQDPAGNVVHLEYDLRERKKLTRDPDVGTWEYTYNGFGDLIDQIDPKNGTTILSYDLLGRQVRKQDPSGKESEWVYDKAEGAGIGKLAAVVSAPDIRLQGACNVRYATLTNGHRAGRWFKYDAFGQLEETTECADGKTFVTTFGYDDFGRQNRVEYPAMQSSRFAVDYHYTSLGFLHYLTDASDDTVLWAATEVNPLGQVTREYTHNGVETVSNRNASTGWLLSRSSTAHADNETLIQSWGYEYDEAGNLRRRLRTDRVNAAESEETFDYDQLDRLTGAHARLPNTTQDLRSESYGYDDIGNILNKGDNVYQYTGCLSATGPHAVCQVTGRSPLAYDEIGNVVDDGAGRTISYDAANRPIEIDSHPAQSAGNDTGVVNFVYGADGNRVVQAVTDANGVEARTIYVGLGGTGKSLYERTARSNSVEHTHFIYAGNAHQGNAFALRVVTESDAAQPEAATRYYHADHLGSVTAVSDERGHVIDARWDPVNPGVLNYDAWGARRASETVAANPAAFDLPAGHRGFTGHESIPNVGLVNMNGRVYDPLLGRFLSPDPNIQFAADLQSYNRYSYALNNPLRYTDPTGYFIAPWFDKLVNIGLTIAAFAVCTGPQAAGCSMAFAAIAAAYNTTSAINSGVAWDQAIAVNLVGFAVGQVAGAYGSGAGSALIADGADPMVGKIIGGAVSGAISSTLMTPMTGGSLGKNVLSGAFEGALGGAVSEVASRVIAVSKATAAEAERVKHEYAREEAAWKAAYASQIADKLWMCEGCLEGSPNSSASLWPGPLLVRLGFGATLTAVKGLGFFVGFEYNPDDIFSGTLVLQGSAQAGAGGSVNLGYVTHGRIKEGFDFQVRGVANAGPFQLRVPFTSYSGEPAGRFGLVLGGGLRADIEGVATLKIQPLPHVFNAAYNTNFVQTMLGGAIQWLAGQGFPLW